MQGEEIIRPIVGQWYYDRANEREFEVLSLDKEEGTIEIQYLEGETEELEFDIWEDMNLAKIAEPEDWSEDGEIEKDDDVEDLEEIGDDDDWDPLEDDDTWED